MSRAHPSGAPLFRYSRTCMPPNTFQTKGTTRGIGRLATPALLPKGFALEGVTL
jgi:hypothetical protein